MSDRFFSSSPITADIAQLEGPEAHHLSHVMRAAAGERVTLFDGSGAEFDAVIEKLNRRAVELRILERREIDRELEFPLVVGVTLPKGDRQKWLVEKLTELGVTTLVPLVTERGVAQPTAGAIERLNRTVIEACKQCGRNRLMEIAGPQTWNDWVASESDVPFTHRVVAHPGGQPPRKIDVGSPAATQIAIGPEGGLTDAEIATATASNWQSINLGPRVLRVETAAVALATHIVLQQERFRLPNSR
jgi:16S rRNA (uracil1498-N3)-methyltransferase